MKMETGVKRLDELLDGGLPEQSCTMVVGPPFLGKDVLTRMFVLQGLRQGTPALMVCTDASASEVAMRLTDIDPDVPQYLEKGLLRFVDTYSRTIGEDEEHPCAEYVDGTLNLSAISAAVNAAERKLLETSNSHRLVFDSLSTLLAYTNPQTTFRFLQVLIGKTKRAGATSLMLLESGMHAEADVQMLKHLMDGFIEAKPENGKFLLRVEGLGVTDSRGWVEYRFTEHQLEITGSFAAGRIR